MAEHKEETSGFRRQLSVMLRRIMIAGLLLITTIVAVEESLFVLFGRHASADVGTSKELAPWDGYRFFLRYDWMVTYSFTNHEGRRITGESPVASGWEPSKDGKAIILYRPGHSRLVQPWDSWMVFSCWASTLMLAILECSPWIREKLKMRRLLRGDSPAEKGKLYQF
jgi:hypothetical protein